MNFLQIKKRYENELYECVIPFWEKHCPDRQFGGYFTSLDRDGSVYDTEKYMWMQWRIVYMFAKLAVAQGGNDIAVQLRLVSAVTTLLGIDQDCVAIYQREGQR